MNNVAANPDRKFVVPDKILLATNLEDADILLPHGVAQAQAAGAALTLAHVIPNAETVPLDARAISPADAAAITLDATNTLQEMASRVRSAGIDCDIALRQGSPQDVIPELVKTARADRLILGTHGRRHLMKLLLGSVAREILSRVEVPVYIIGPHAQTASVSGKPLKILHPVSLRPGYERSARLALDLAQFYQAEITLLHVLSRGIEHKYDPSRIAEQTRLELQRLVPDEAPLWTFVNSQVEVGRAVDHILSSAREVGADLIVLGTDAAGSFWPIRGDDTAYEIIARADCPVLTLRHSVAADELRARSEKMTDVRSVFAGMF